MGRFGRGLRWLAVIAMFCATLLCTIFPPFFAAPIMTPMVASLLFLTIPAFLYHIILSERSETSRDGIGHLLWLAGLFWSPKTAYFGTLIWWPYLMLRNTGATIYERGALLALVKGALQGIVALVVARDGAGSAAMAGVGARHYADRLSRLCAGAARPEGLTGGARRPCGMIAFIATFNFGPWRRGIAGHGITSGPAALLSHLTAASTIDHASMLMSTDAVWALESCGMERGVPLDEGRILLRNSTDSIT